MSLSLSLGRPFWRQSATGSSGTRARMIEGERDGEGCNVRWQQQEPSAAAATGGSAAATAATASTGASAARRPAAAAVAAAQPSFRQAHSLQSPAPALPTRPHLLSASALLRSSLSLSPSLSFSFFSFAEKQQQHLRPLVRSFQLDTHTHTLAGRSSPPDDATTLGALARLRVRVCAIV